MKHLLLAALLAASGLAIYSPEPASAAVCADYDNQAEAQRAKDTRDADGDGLFCEALPCPCAGPGSGGGGGSGGKAKKKKKKPKPKPTYTYRGYVTEVIEGDTIKVKLNSGGTTTVRLIGIDSPSAAGLTTPIECGALESRSAAIEWSFGEHVDSNGDGLWDSGTEGYDVTLKTDNTQRRYDSKGRLLAYVYDVNDESLQRTLLRAGLADTYYSNGKSFRKAASYERDWDSASRNSRGVFGKCEGDFHLEGS